MRPKQTVPFDTPTAQEGPVSTLGGSPSTAWNTLITNSVIMALPQYRNREGTPLELLPIVIAGLSGIAPRDAMEGMLAAQMLACHHASMDCFRRATNGELSVQVRNEALSQAGKLSRTYAMLVEALNRHRGKGQQKVTVEHVHVHSGGQAIVGNVKHPGGGARAKRKE